MNSAGLESVVLDWDDQGTHTHHTCFVLEEALPGPPGESPCLVLKRRESDVLKTLDLVIMDIHTHDAVYLTLGTTREVAQSAVEAASESGADL